MKKYLFGLFAVALAVGFSAFTTKNFQYYVIDKETISSVEYYVVQPANPGSCGTGTAEPCLATFSQDKDGSNRIPVSALVSTQSQQEPF